MSGATLDLDKLREFCELGMPFSEIAKRLGTIRNIAKSRAWRMGLGRGEEGRIEALVAWHQSNREAHLAACRERRGGGGG